MDAGAIPAFAGSPEVATRLHRPEFGRDDCRRCSAVDDRFPGHAARLSASSISRHTNCGMGRGCRLTLSRRIRAATRLSRPAFSRSISPSAKVVVEEQRIERPGACPDEDECEGLGRGRGESDQIAVIAQSHQDDARSRRTACKKPRPDQAPQNRGGHGERCRSRVRRDGKNAKRNCQRYPEDQGRGVACKVSTSAKRALHQSTMGQVPAKP